MLSHQVLSVQLLRRKLFNEDGKSDFERNPQGFWENMGENKNSFFKVTTADGANMGIESVKRFGSC